MHPLLLAVALSAAPVSGQPTVAETVECTAQRLRQFMSPTGIVQSWPKATDLPSSLQSWTGTLLSGSGPVMDGFTQTLHVDVPARSAYVVEQGGYAGTARIYGPLPVAGCPGAAAL